MTDDGAAPKTGDSVGETPQARVDMEYVDSLPGGRAVMAVEAKGCFTWLVVRGHVSQQARDEMVSDLNHIVGKGLWRQDWQPPEGDTSS